MYLFLSGGIAAFSLTISLFFLKLWKNSRDRLFIIFSASFFLIASERFILLAADFPDETRPYVYLVRLLAFVLIAGAILDKNISSRKN